jgi:hypothetical protein
VFDLPEFLPFLASIKRISVTYGTHDEVGLPGSTNVVKPLYHVAWLASRLGMRVTSPLAHVDARRPGTPVRLRPGEKPPMDRGLAGKLRGASDVTAEAENVHVHTWLDGVQAIDRTFKAPRRGDVDLLGEALETGGRDPLAVETIRKAAELIGHHHVD